MVLTEPEYVAIDGVPLATPAWYTLNLWALWQSPKTRGSDRIVPRADGVRPYRRRPTATRVTLGLVIVGDRDPDGGIWTDARAGLLHNLDLFKAGVVASPVRTDGTRLAELYLPDGTVRAGRVHVEGLDLGGDRGPFALSATLDLTLIQGELT